MARALIVKPMNSQGIGGGGLKFNPQTQTKSTAGTGTINLIALVTLGIHSAGETFTSG